MFNLFKKQETVDYKKLIKEGAIIVDVRSAEEFSDGHIGGALNIPLDVLLSHLSKIGDAKKPVITCCASGRRSSMAKDMLEKAGYKHVYNGGGWRTLKSKL